jgi:hypothetical protein
LDLSLKFRDTRLSLRSIQYSESTALLRFGEARIQIVAGHPPGFNLGTLFLNRSQHELHF